MKTAAVIVLFLAIQTILWAGATSAQDYSFSYTCDNQGLVIHPDSLGLFTTVLANTGALADSYKVHLDKDLPLPWQAIACLPWACFFDSATVVLEPDSLVQITLDIIPVGFPGAGTVTMRVRSQGDPEQIVAIPLVVITNTGVDVLIVDDDGTQDYEKYYQAALDSAGRSHGTLDNATTVIGADELAPFSAVVWFTGEARPVLTAEDRETISGYLEGGGRLFISGQDIAYALCDPASGESDVYACSWFQDKFISYYVSDNSDTLMLEGMPEDPISQDITLHISGGDGANNQTSPDVIAPDLWDWDLYVDETFQYPGTIDWQFFGAVRVHHWMVARPKIVYFSFGFEAINNNVDRTLVMKRIMDWLMTPTPVEDQVEFVTHPQSFFLSPNYPNPFNAATTFALYVPGEIPVPISVNIYNILGQEVRTLVDGPVGPGSHLILWDGKDDAGADLASGVYFSRMAVGDFSQTRKLVLTR